MRDGWKTVRVGEIAQQVRRRILVSMDKEYPLLGVRWYGAGPFHRETVTGATSKAKQLFRVREDDFIYNRLFAWKGAFGVIPVEIDGYYVSGEFPVFELDRASLLPHYLNLLMCRPEVWAQIERESTGSTATSRNRWKEDRFLEYFLRLPPIDQQLRVVAIIEAVQAVTTAAQKVRLGADEAIAALSSQLIDRSEAPLLPLGEGATIEAALVDPTAPEFRDLPHVGIERIESGTGRLLETASAAEDGVTSAKYLFSADDVVYSKIRPNLRKVVRPSRVGLSSADAYPLRARQQVLADYLFEVLLSRSFSTQAVARSGRTKMPKINRAELFSILIPVPSLDLQAAIASLLASVRDVRDRAATECALTESLGSALLADLLSGNHEIPDSYDILLESAS